MLGIVFWVQLVRMRIPVCVLRENRVSKRDEHDGTMNELSILDKMFKYATIIAT